MYRYFIHQYQNEKVSCGNGLLYPLFPSEIPAIWFRNDLRYIRKKYNDIRLNMSHGF